MSSQQGEDSDLLCSIKCAITAHRSFRNSYSFFSPRRPYLTWSQPGFLVNEADTSTQSAQASIESKYSTLHTCGTKVLPCEEDGVVVVLGVVGVVPLLRVRPSAHLLQAARRVATLDQANGLQEAGREQSSDCRGDADHLQSDANQLLLIKINGSVIPAESCQVTGWWWTRWFWHTAITLQTGSKS